MRERIRKQWPWLGYYGGLFRALPRLVIGATDTVGSFLGGLVLLALVLGAGTAFVTLEGWRVWIALAIAALVLLGLARLNYQEIAKRDAEVWKLRRQVIGYQQEYLFDKWHYQLIDELVTESVVGQLHGYSELIKRLNNGEGSPAELTAAFDKWDAGVAQHVGWIEPEEVAFLQRPVEVTLIAGDWRDRLRTMLEVRKSRIEEIHTRQKFRYDRKVAERKEKDKQAQGTG